MPPDKERFPEVPDDLKFQRYSNVWKKGSNAEGVIARSNVTVGPETFHAMTGDKSLKKELWDKLIGLREIFK